MALRHIEGFEVYGTGVTGSANFRRNPKVERLTFGNVTIGTAGGFLPPRCGSGYLTLPSQAADWAFRIAPGYSGNVVGCGMGFAMMGYPANNFSTPRVAAFLDAAGNAFGAVTVNANGSVSFNTGVYMTSTNTPGTIICQSAPMVVPVSTWVHIEAKLTVSASGSIEIRVNGVTVASASGINFGTAQCTTVAAWGSTYHGTAIPATMYDDLVFWDGNDGGVVDFYGDGRVSALLPTANSSVTWGRTGAASNAAAIGTATPDGDTSTINAASAGLVDTFTLADVPGTALTIGGIQTVIDVTKTDAGVGTVTHGLLSGASVSASPAATPSTTAYAYLTAVHPVDPATGVAWTPTGVNNAKFRVSREA